MIHCHVEEDIRRQAGTDREKGEMPDRRRKQQNGKSEPGSSRRSRGGHEDVQRVDEIPEPESVHSLGSEGAATTKAQFSSSASVSTRSSLSSQQHQQHHHNIRLSLPPPSSSSANSSSTGILLENQPPSSRSYAGFHSSRAARTLSDPASATIHHLGQAQINRYCKNTKNSSCPGEIYT
jgi:hypothetical protein